MLGPHLSVAKYSGLCFCFCGITEHLCSPSLCVGASWLLLKIIAYLTSCLLLHANCLEVPFAMGFNSNTLLDQKLPYCSPPKYVPIFGRYGYGMGVAYCITLCAIK